MWQGEVPARPAEDTLVYLPLIQLSELPCNSATIAQLKGVSKWRGEFSLAFKGNASGTWPGGDTEETRVDHVLRMGTLVLSKTHDTPTFVAWRMSGFVRNGELVVNDSDVYTFKSGGSSSMTAQFTEAAGSDVVSIALYLDQCKLRLNLDGTAIGPVTGDLRPNDTFDVCAVLDVKSPSAGAQTLSTSVPLYLLGGGTAGAYEDARKAGAKCRVGGGDPNVGQELFTSKLAWLLDGATTSGPRGKGDLPMGNVQVSYTFSPVP